MTHKLALLSFLGLSLLTSACVDELDPSAPTVAERDQPDLESAPPQSTVGGQAAGLFVDEEKTEIDTTGKTTCTNDNSPCFAADQGKCPDADGKYTGACYCTHCVGGGVCENSADHEAHDEKCKLKPKAIAVDVLEAF